ncbi:AMP-binding protein [Leptolyngbya sp. 7M]|nr:AMP-binding protein [Leptolyngbya sp. 7M]
MIEYFASFVCVIVIPMADYNVQLRALMQPIGMTSFRALSRAAGVSKWQVELLRTGRVAQMRVEVLLKLGQVLQLSIDQLVERFSGTPIESNGSVVSSTAQPVQNQVSGRQSQQSEAVLQQSLEQLRQEYQRLQTQLAQQRTTLDDYSAESSQIHGKAALLRDAMTLLENPPILTEQALQPQLQSFCQQVDCQPRAILTLEALLNEKPATEFYAANPDDLALLLFTSGSTGTPKGVMLSGRNLMVSVYGMATANRLTSDSISLNWMPLEHVASLVMFHLTQMYLGCDQIHVANELVLQQPLRWLDWIDQYRVTHTWAPNFAYSLINDRAEEMQSRVWDLSCLRWMGNGAEAVVGKTTRRFLQLLADYGLDQTVVSPGYGMSETCSGIVHSHQFTLDTTSDADTFVDVGVPIPGVKLRIVDENNQVLPETIIGHLQVNGLTVMQGYYRRPDLTAAVFTPDCWFDTGDLAFLKAGRLTITGRQKEVIIINGVNYYSHEIEAAVEQLASVAISFTAACAVRLPNDSTDRLAIFFSPLTESVEPLIKAIRRQVMQTIGITPSLVIPLPQTEIPKTNLGKIQRRQLVERFAAGEFDSLVSSLAATTASLRDQPQNQLERQIAQIWQDVLRLPAVGVQDNFFELGGNSVLLMQVLQRLQTELAPSLTAVTLFQYPAIAALVGFEYLVDGCTQITLDGAVLTLGHRLLNNLAVNKLAGRFSFRQLEKFLQGRARELHHFRSG